MLAAARIVDGALTRLTATGGTIEQAVEFYVRATTVLNEPVVRLKSASSPSQSCQFLLELAGPKRAGNVNAAARKSRVGELLRTFADKIPYLLLKRMHALRRPHLPDRMPHSTPRHASLAPQGLALPD